MEPDPAVTPVFVRPAPDGSCVAEYLNSSLETVRLTLYAEGVYRKHGHSDDPLADEHLDMLRTWIVDYGMVDTTAASDFITALRDEVEWFLERGWVRTETGPRLLRRAIERKCESHEGMDPDIVFRWALGLLR